MVEKSGLAGRLVLGKDAGTFVALCLLSSVLIRVWFTLVANLRSLFGPEAIAADGGMLLVAAFFLPAAIARFACSTSFYALSLHDKSRWGTAAAIAAALCLAVSTLGCLAVGNEKPAAAALIAFGLAAGLGYEAFLLLWYELFANLGYDSAKRLILWRIGIDALAAFLCLLESLPIACFCIIIALVSFVGFIRSVHYVAANPPRRKQPWLAFEPARHERLALGIFLLCAGFAFMQSAFQSPNAAAIGPFSVGESAALLGRLLTFAVVAAVLALCREQPFGLLMRMAVFFGIGGFLCLLLPWKHAFLVYCTASVASAFFVEYAVSLMTIYVASYAKTAPLTIISWGQAVMRLAGLPTMIIGLTLAPHVAVESGNVALPYIIAVAVMLLTIVGIWLLDERTVASFLWGRGATPKKASSNDDAPDPKIMRIATEHGLTEREVEILRLLLEGRSVPYIKETLYISSNTAKTHVRHIYQKMGVHNRQELIDRAQS